MGLDVTGLTMIELRDALAARRISSVQATQAYLDRIERLNPTLNAYREVYADRALQQARDADAGLRPGPLCGVPIAIKDNLCTTYGTTTCCSKMLKGYVSPYTATAVLRLEQAGAVILGKTILDEFAMGSSTEHSAFGPSRNPWDVQRVPGGSSGGSAAAVAARLCAAAIASDTGGSIRQPAALCGLVGYKPTYGLISRYGLVAFASSLDQIGPLTVDVADAALLAQIMGGHDAKDATCAAASSPPLMEPLDQPLGPLRIGLARQYHSDTNHPAVTAAVELARQRLEAQGASVVEVDLPHTAYGIPTYYLVATAEASSNLARYDGIHYGHRSVAAIDDLADLYSRSRAEGFGDEVKRRIMLGTYALSSGYYDAYYLKALKVRRLIKNDFDAAFERVDAILCPTVTHPAFKFGEKTDDPLSMYLNDVYTVNCNLAGIAGVSVPLGTTHTFGTDAASSPLPVGVQLLGQAFDDARLLRIAAAVMAQDPVLRPAC